MSTFEQRKNKLLNIQKQMEEKLRELEEKRALEIAKIAVQTGLGTIENHKLRALFKRFIAQEQSGDHDEKHSA